MTDDGYCVEYRESLLQHFARLGSFFDRKPMPISGQQIGVDRALKFYGLSRQGEFGDRRDEYKEGEKPSFLDFVALWKWESWESYRGTDKVIAQKASVVIMHEILKEFGYEKLIPDPNRPGPDYYKDCTKFNWVDALVKKHKQKTGFEYAESKSELDAILKLTQKGQMISPAAGILGLSVIYFSII